MKKQIRKKEIKEINEELEASYQIGEFIDKKARAEIEENQNNDTVLIINNELSFFKKESKWIPTLKLILKNNFLKKAIVDMGAVKFVTSGADIMRPGIKELDNAEKGEIVAIVDETHKKPLAIGKLLFSSKEIQAMQNGKVIANLHYIGDKLWNS